MKAEGKWKVLCDNDTETFLDGCSSMSRVESRVVQVTCDGPSRQILALMSFVLVPHRSSD